MSASQASTTDAVPTPSGRQKHRSPVTRVIRTVGFTALGLLASTVIYVVLVVFNV